MKSFPTTAPFVVISPMCSRIVHTDKGASINIASRLNLGTFKAIGLANKLAFVIIDVSTRPKYKDNKYPTITPINIPNCLINPLPYFLLF